LAARWPASTLLCGFDSSAEMIAAARKACPTRHFRIGAISDWAAGAGEIYDIVFSNAALQWVGEHATLLPQLMKHVAPKGALAIQVPCNYDAPAHEIMREIARSPEWRDHFSEGVPEWRVHDLPQYYDILAPCAATLDPMGKLAPLERHIPSDRKADVASPRLWSSEVTLNYKEVAPTALPKTDFAPEAGLHRFCSCITTKTC
jgi:trans-aconitate methyltransferase